MWSCRQVTERATDRLEGRLTLRDRARLWPHLAICPQCRRYLRQFAGTVALLRALPGEAPQQETMQRLKGAFRAAHGEGRAKP
jgi:predicted anti-sigma-YlaC factor YlaD